MDLDAGNMERVFVAKHRKRCRIENPQDSVAPGSSMDAQPGDLVDPKSDHSSCPSASVVDGACLHF